MFVMKVKSKKKKTQLTWGDIARMAEKREATEYLLKLRKRRMEEAKKRAPMVKKNAIERAREMPHLDKLEHEEARLKVQVKENKIRGRDDVAILLGAKLDGLREEIAARKRERAKKRKLAIERATEAYSYSFKLIAKPELLEKRHMYERMKKIAEGNSNKRLIHHCEDMLEEINEWLKKRK
jgi:hypothetical protein